MNEIDKELIERLKDNSLKLTGQRLKILSLLIENNNKHLSAEDIHNLLLENGERIGIATIYRTIGVLEKLNMIARLYVDDGCIRYQVLDPHKEHEHHHLICQRCGKIVDMQDDLLDNLEGKIKDIYNFKVTNHKVKFYGICSDCLKKDI
jgi:Fur family ferric uptake transcriptional regulator